MDLECRVVEQGLSLQGSREPRQVFKQGATWPDLRQVWGLQWGPGGDGSRDLDGRKEDLSQGQDRGMDRGESPGWRDPRRENAQNMGTTVHGEGQGGKRQG